jgi:hypothetical protein
VSSRWVAGWCFGGVSPTGVEGVAKLLGVEGDVACGSRAAGCFPPRSGSRGQANDLIPGGEAGGHFVSVVIRGEAVAAGPKVR